MKNKYFDIELLKTISKLTNLSHDGDQGDNRLHYEQDRINVFASVMTRKEYDKMEKDISKKSIKGKGYEVYAWNDISGFDYWNNDTDGNYIQITVQLTDLNKLNIEQLKQDADSLFEYFQKYDNLEQYYAKKTKGL